MPIQRPTIPDTCDSHLADLIKCCWQEDAKVCMHIDLKHLLVANVLCVYCIRWYSKFFLAIESDEQSFQQSILLACICVHLISVLINPYHYRNSKIW